MSNKPIRILVVDDHYVVRVGVVAILNLNPQFVVVGEAEDGARALELYRQHQPEITLMDLRMPGTGGVAATRAILEEFPAARIIVLTTYDAEEDIHGALKAGVKGYISKQALGEELVNAIQAVEAGGQFISTHLERRLAERVPGMELTERELAVLQLMAKGLHNEEIGRLVHVSRSSVKLHVQNILQKLGVSDRTEAVAAALQRGILRLD